MPETSLERHIIFDTETTGFDPATGDKIVEIGALEMIDFELTGEEFHCYLNPERDMPDSAFQVHGLGDDFLADKPLFADMAQGFLDFVGDGILVAHAASFDMKFIQAELEANGFKSLNNKVVDTLILARQKFTGQKNSLDALTDRFGIDSSMREKHGALLDSKILAEVYLELLGKRQRGLLDGATHQDDKHALVELEDDINTPQHRLEQKIIIKASDDELTAHQAMQENFGNDCLWKKH